MRKSCLLLYVFILAAFFSCNGTPELVKLAKKQMPSTIQEAMTERFGAVKDLSLDSLGVVYQDDSICILQCWAHAKTLNDKPVERQYRYYYLFNVEMSNINHKMIFNDGYIDLPILPKSKIDSGYIEKQYNHQSVYEALYARTTPIKHPVGNKYMDKESKR